MSNDMNCVVMFPYPSGAGLHLGHYYNYAIIDSYCRWHRFKGHDVFQPFGYDSFGLPAENYARQIGGDPKEVTEQNIVRFRSQMDRMNTCYEEKLITSEPNYVKWTQWIFKRMQDKNLAYKTWGNVNWCPSCETVLANEQVKNGQCDRCNSKVETKNLNQWYFRITEYKDRLIKNLPISGLPPTSIKMQAVWLENLTDWCVSRQRKWGCPIPVDGETDTLDTFVDSSFYYLRYLTDNPDVFLPQGSYKPIDLYVGGSEHTCMHLIYTRFVHMVLFDLGIVPTEEPFRRVIHQGMITKNGAKMSKSKGNAVDPDDYDPDELRMQLMFIGHYFDGGEWDDRAIVGIKRFFDKMRRWLSTASASGNKIDLTKFENDTHQKVELFKFNKIVSGFMEFYNSNKNITPDIETAIKVENLLRIFAPGFTSKIHIDI